MQFSKNASKLTIGESQNPQKGCDNASLNTLMSRSTLSAGK